MGRVALVTGGSRGIGEAISKQLKADGYEVAATYAGNDEKAAAFTAETGIKTYKWNVADYAASEAGIAQVEAELGPIDTVVANAGITRDGFFHKMTPEQWNEVIGTNLTGVFNTVRPVWPGMRERGFGRVIVISSINGQKGQAGQVNYAATKAGDLGIVKSLAQEGAVAGDAGVGDDDVDRAEIGFDLRDARFGAFVVGHVPLVGLDAGFGGESGGLLVIAGVSCGDFVAVGFELLGDGFADTARTTSY